MAELMGATQRDLQAQDDSSQAHLDAVASRIAERLSVGRFG